MNGFEKEAAGELTARVARWLSTPIKGTPKLVQKVRTGPELDALEQGIRDGANRYVVSPIRAGLNHIGADRAVESIAHAAAPIVKPKLGPISRRQWADQVGKNVVNLIANKPHSALGHAPIVPIPGTGFAVDALDSLKTKFLNATPGLRVPTYNTRTPPRKGGIVSGEIASPALAGGNMSKLAQVHPYQQQTQWTCSAACFKAVLAHYGIRIPEVAAVELVGAQPGRGAECDQIAAAARKMGLLSFEYSFDSIDQAKVLLDQGIPIICDVQSFNNPGKGHYVVLVSADDSRVELMDPNTPGNWRIISISEMNARWWDKAMAAPHDMMWKWGIVIVPPED